MASRRRRSRPRPASPYEARVARAFTRAVGKLRAAVFEDDGSGAVDVVSRSEAIPVDAILDDHLSPVLVDLLAADATRAMRAAYEAGTKAFDWTLADQLASEWAQTQAGALVSHVSRKTKEAIRDVVALGVRENHSIAEIAKNLRATIGLSPREARAVARMRRALIADGLNATKAEARVARRADQLVRRRAKLIAQHETATATEMGKLHEWRIMVANGDVPSSVRRKWMARDPCPLCRELAALAPVPLGQPFRTRRGETYQAPPAHLRCKCSVVLIMTGSRTRRAESHPGSPAFSPVSFRRSSLAARTGIA